MDPIQAAIGDIESLRPGEQFSYTQMAKKYSVVRSTLTRRHIHVTQAHALSYDNLRNLSQQQEQEFLRYIKRLTERGLPPTRQMIQSFASKIAREQVSMSWVDRFTRRNTESLLSRWTAGIDSNRHKADSPAK
ncbi:hypothetical protein DM02DRAFT_485605, partial [Periconia macrospinosa]